MGSSSSTHVHTSDTHPMQIDYIPSEYLPQNSKLGIMMCPGRSKGCWRRDLAKDMTRIRDEYRVQTIVTLVRSIELEKMHIPDYLAIVQSEEYGNMKSMHFPIVDKWLPGDKLLFCHLIDFIIGELKQQRSVVVHCNGGKGRAATVCTCVLLALQIHSHSISCDTYVSNMNEAISIVRTARGGGTLKNPLQIMWIRTKFLSAYNNQITVTE